MKLPTLLLVGSLVANAALFTVYRMRSADGAQTAGEAREASHLAIRPGSTAARATAPEPEEVLDETFWKPDTPEGLAPLVARLREAGFPRYAIRLITMVQLDEMFAPRVKEIFPEPIPFWESERSPAALEKMAAFRALQKEHRALMRELLGPDATANSADIEFLQARSFGDIPPDKIAQIQKITSDYSELRMDILAGVANTPTAEDREKMSFLDKEMQADLTATLSPEELEQYNLRNSSTASQLRFRLAGFKPNEEEFRAIFKVQQAFDEEMGGSRVYTAAQYRERQARQAEVDAKLEPLLSPERFAEYKLATNPDFNYAAVNRVVARFDLPVAATTEVVAVRNNFTERATALRKDETLSPEQRNAQLAAIAQEAHAQVEKILGPKATNAYKENGGQWLQPTPPPSTAPATGTLLIAQ